MKTRGKCSWFGGPDDSGVSSSEDLAFIYSVDDQPEIFLSEQPPGTTGLARRLDPSEFYVACRWPYTSETKAVWRDALLSRKALVRNPKNKKYAWAFPADWGPADEETGGRVADLSPALLEHLGLDTDDEVQVWFPTKQVTLPTPPPQEGLPYPSVVISAGHGLLIRGASGITESTPWGLDEVDEARKVVTAVADALRRKGVLVVEYFDDISTTQNENLERICDTHNSVEARDLDISVHFNAYDGTAHGCEVYAISQMDLAGDVSEAISVAGGFTNRGAKSGSNLYFCNHTEAGSLLIETAFCDQHGDCDLYRERFGAITQAIADVLTGKQVVA